MLVIDTYNVMHVHGVLPPELVLHSVSELAWLLGRSRYAGTPQLLVCDGPMQGTGHVGPSATLIGETRVVYTGAGREADDEIEALLERTSHPTRLLIVSSDRRIIKAARSRRAPSLKSDALLRQLALDAQRREREPLPRWVHEIPLPRSSVDHWLDTFGLSDEQAAGLGGSGGEIGKEDLRRKTPPVGEERAQAGASGEQRSEPGSQPPVPPELDEQTRKLAEQQGLDLEDLDMRRWLGE